jgi:hypothetical protein
MMLTLGLSNISLFVLRDTPSFPSFFTAFVMKGCWILPKAFPTFIEMICNVFLYSVYMLSYICWFSYPEPFLHPWN